tara:strand:+ start:13 stop:1011 length:999 start_codon:yes stop_codon:yes gene_type:complete
MVDNNNILNAINNIYDDMSYTEAYSYDIWFTIVVFIIFILLIIYFYVIANLKKLNKDWDNIRCNPAFIPFSDIITRGKYSVRGNFKSCLDEFTNEIAIESSNPFEFIFIILTALFKFIYNLFIRFMFVFVDIINFLLQLLHYIYIKFKLLTNEITFIYIKIHDIFNKAIGTILLFFYSLTKMVDMVKYLLILICNWYFRCIVIPLARLNVLFYTISMVLLVIFYILGIFVGVLVYNLYNPVFWYSYGIIFTLWMAVTVILSFTLSTYATINKIHVVSLNTGLNLNSSIISFVNSFGTKMTIPDRMGPVKLAEKRQQEVGLDELPSSECFKDD